MSFGLLTMRFAVVSIIVLVLAHLFRQELVAPLTPVIHDTVRLVAPEFSLVSQDIVQQGRNEVLRVRANLSVPMEYAGHQLNPFGWNGTPAGGYQISMTLGGILQYAAFMLIVVLAWPLNGFKDLVVRCILWMPLALVLFILDTPLTVIAELWNGLRNHFAPDSPCGWMVWARFLQGGGGFMLAALMGMLVIAASARLTNGASWRKSSPDKNYARLVLPHKIS